MKTDIWMPIYCGDWLKDTSHLSQGQHGAYFLLLIHYWQKRELKADKKQCYRIARAFTQEEIENVDAVLSEFFTLTNGNLIQKRVEIELKLALEKKEKAVKKAQKAAGERWRKDASSKPQALLEDMLELCPSPSPAPTALPIALDFKKRKPKNIKPQPTRVNLTPEDEDWDVPF